MAKGKQKSKTKPKTEINVNNTDVTNILEGETTVASFKYSNCDKLREAYLPDTVLCVEKGAFKNCFNLEELTLSSNLTTIEDEAFMNCGRLDVVELPQSLTTIGRNVFKGCDNLSNIHYFYIIFNVEEFENVAEYIEQNKCDIRTAIANLYPEVYNNSVNYLKQLEKDIEEFYSGVIEK